MPRLSSSWSKRLRPRIRSRTISSVQRSPISSRDQAIEQTCPSYSRFSITTTLPHVTCVTQVSSCMVACVKQVEGGRAVKAKPLVLFSLLLAAFVINLDTTIVNVALPTLVRELHASNTQLQWVVDAFSLLFAASVLAVGSLSDRFGRKGMLLAGLAVFGAASLAGGLLNSAGQLIAARAVMGVGAAMVFPSTLSLLTNVFRERRERALAIGLWGAVTGVAIALGPIVGGWLLELSSWRSIFIAMTPIAAIAGVLAARFVPSSRDPRAPRLDSLGFVLSTATIALLVYTIIEAPNHGWANSRTLGGFALSV